jgi:hypothetical protein
MPLRKEIRHHYTTPSWRATSLRIRKGRAGDRCECTGECGTNHLSENRAMCGDGPEAVVTKRCSAFDGRPHPRTRSRVRLTVAHLDHTPGHDDDENLRAMCQRCHNRYDTTFRKANANRTRRNKKAAGDLFGATS